MSLQLLSKLNRAQQMETFVPTTETRNQLSMTNCVTLAQVTITESLFVIHYRPYLSAHQVRNVFLYVFPRHRFVPN